VRLAEQLQESRLGGGAVAALLALRPLAASADQEEEPRIDLTRSGQVGLCTVVEPAVCRGIIGTFQLNFAIFWPRVCQSGGGCFRFLLRPGQENPVHSRVHHSSVWHDGVGVCGGGGGSLHDVIAAISTDTAEQVGMPSPRQLIWDSAPRSPALCATLRNGAIENASRGGGGGSRTCRWQCHSC